MQRDFCGGAVDRAETFGRKFQRQRAVVLIQTIELPRAGNWHNPWLLRQGSPSCAPRFCQQFDQVLPKPPRSSGVPNRR